MSRDELLVARVAKRDKEALSALYDRYQRMVWNFACRSHVDSHAREELVSRVFSHLWLQPQDFRSETNFAALLLKCCRSKSLEMQEKKCC